MRLLTALILLATPLPGQDPAGHWAFDGNLANQRLEESYGKGSLNATAEIAPSIWGSRINFGQTLANESSPQYLSLPNLAELDPGTSDFSISVWLKRTSNSGSTAGIIDALGGIGNGFQLFFQADNSIRVRLDDTDNQSVIADTSGPQFALNTWRHCYLAIDRQNDRVHILLDGTEATPAGGIDISTLTGSLTPNQNWWIGNLNNSTPSHGDLDDLAIFQRLLTPEEISKLASGKTILSQFPPAPGIPRVEIDPPSGVLPSDRTVTLSSEPDLIIRYTTDGSEPTELSPLYTAPILLEGDLQIRARSFSGANPGPISEANYLRIPADSPNVLIIIADDLGFNDLGCYGAAAVATPALDQLAAQGLRFTQFTTSGPGDLASQYALLTGRLAARSNLPETIPPSTSGLDSREWTLAESLRKSDYQTALIGTWYLGTNPTNQGFTLFYGLPNSIIHSPPLVENDTTITPTPRAETLLGMMTTRASTFLDGLAPSDSFFLCFSPPSLPATGTSLLGDYGNRIEALDQSIATLLAKLNETNRADNTLVIFLSDSGADRNTGTFPTGSNGQLRDGKNTTWEGGLRSPFIARWHGVIAPGEDSQAVLWLPDLFPTISVLCQSYLPTDRPLDGRDESALLLGAVKKPRFDKTIFSYRYSASDYQLATVRTGAWKLHKTRINSDPENSIIATPPLLYQLEVDPTERIRRESSEPTLVATLDSKITAHQTTLTGPQLPAPLPAILGNSGVTPVPVGSTTFKLNFQRPATSLNEHYFLQHSNDLMNWDDLPLSAFIEQIEFLMDGTERVHLVISASSFSPSSSSRFIRIKSTRP